MGPPAPRRQIHRRGWGSGPAFPPSLSARVVDGETRTRKVAQQRAIEPRDSGSTTRAGTRANSSRKRSDGIGPIARRTRCGGVRTASQTLRGAVVGQLDRDVSGRIARADNKNVAPRKGHALRKSPESPVRRRNDPGRATAARRACGTGRWPARRQRPDFPRRGVDPPAPCRAADTGDLASEPKIDVLQLYVAVEVADHVLLGRPTAGRQAEESAAPEDATGTRSCSGGSCRSDSATKPQVLLPSRRPEPKSDGDARARARQRDRTARLR